MTSQTPSPLPSPSSLPVARLSTDDAEAHPKLVAAMSLNDFERAGLVVTLHSASFDEEVVLASDDALVPEDESRVVYRASELRWILERGTEELRRLHRLKRSARGCGFALTVDSAEEG